MKNILKNRLIKGIVTTPVAEETLYGPEAMEAAGLDLKARIDKNFGRSFHLREVDTGSCGACESEINATINPIYDLQRFGIDFVASPRHADALLVTGPVSKNMVLALQKTYDAMPHPKFVIALGNCAIDGGVFKDSYYTAGGVGAVLPVSLRIPGCPPQPLDIIRFLLGFLKNPATH
jgi:Ni,Fe-hydrogenase III small subunit